MCKHKHTAGKKRATQMKVKCFVYFHSHTQKNEKKKCISDELTGINAQQTSPVEFPYFSDI